MTDEIKDSAVPVKSYLAKEERLLAKRHSIESGVTQKDQIRQAIKEFYERLAKKYS